MNRPDIVEIWLGDQVLLRINSAFAPAEGDLINIAKVTYRVIGRSFSIDHTIHVALRQFRCNVIVQVEP